MRATWTPEGFDRYRDLYPRTPALAPDPDRGATRRFARSWAACASGAPARLRARADRTSLVFVRGYLGHYMPRSLVAARDAARGAGFDAFIARNRAGGDLATNVAALEREVRDRPRRARLVFCAHSRAGVECLHLLADRHAIADRCDGVALSQAPYGASRVMESVLLHRHRGPGFGLRRRVAEEAQRLALGAIGALPGGRELTGEVWPGRVAAVGRRKWPFPIVQTASWSTRPTAWLDSFHGRLAEIAPGEAHDGQFLLRDLIWPELDHVLLPEVDHAQPVVGGLGFDSARYWLALVDLLLDSGPASGGGGRDGD